MPQPQISYLSEQERWHQRYVLTTPWRAWPAPTTTRPLPTSHGACSPHHTGMCHWRVQGAQGREPHGRPHGQVEQLMRCSMLVGSLGALFGSWEPWRHLSPWRFFASDETHPSSRCNLSLRQTLSLRPIAEVELSLWGVRSHFEEGKKQPSEFLNSGTVDILGQIIDSRHHRRQHHQSQQPKMSPDIAKYPLGGQNCPRSRTINLGASDQWLGSAGAPLNSFTVSC